MGKWGASPACRRRQVGVRQGGVTPLVPRCQTFLKGWVELADQICQVFFHCRRANSVDPNRFTNNPIISNAPPTKCTGCKVSPNASQPVVKPTKGTSKVKGAIRLTG